MWIGPGESRGLSSWLNLTFYGKGVVVVILGGNKPVQRPASTSDARKRQEGMVGESSTDALRVAPSPLPEGSDETFGQLHCGPCVHCGHLRDEHGEREACLRAGFYGNHYGCCLIEHKVRP